MSRKHPVVDLMAVRRDREALAAIVRKYPELKTPEARERLGAYLKEEDAAQERKGTRRRPVRRPAGK